MDAPEGSKDKRSLAGKHRQFQFRIATMFFVSAVLVGIWMLFVPRPVGVTGAAVLLFVQLPLFVILALVGMNALVRAGMGPKRKG